MVFAFWIYKLTFFSSCKSAMSPFMKLLSYWGDLTILFNFLISDNWDKESTNQDSSPEYILGVVIRFNIVISEADGDSIKMTPENSYLWVWHVYIGGHGQRFCKASKTKIKRINNDIISAAPVLKINTMSSCGNPFVADQGSSTEVAPVYPHWHLFVYISNIISNKLLKGRNQLSISIARRRKNPKLSV